jgi:metal-responsive CopG/Arc/MetJ family transcriptional regulator
MARMRRIEFNLEPELVASLDRLAGQRGTSRAALLREAAWQLVALAETLEADSIFGIIGLGHDDRTDVSLRHDDYLIQAKLDRMQH